MLIFIHLFTSHWFCLLSMEKEKKQVLKNASFCLEFHISSSIKLSELIYMFEFFTEWRAGQNEFAMEICETNIVHIDWERSAFLKAWCSFNRSWCINRYCWLFSKSFHPLNICYFINSRTNEPNIDWLWELNWQVDLKASANKPYIPFVFIKCITIKWLLFKGKWCL